jgi:hypothetical protein
MSQVIPMIGRIDDLDNPEALTEVWRRAMPVMGLSCMRPEHYLNELENDVMEVGWEAMRTLMAVWASLPMMSAELNQAVETALAQASPQPPTGVRAAWPLTIGNGPIRNMKAHQQQRLFCLRYRCAHVRASPALAPQ